MSFIPDDATLWHPEGMHEVEHKVVYENVINRPHGPWFVELPFRNPDVRYRVRIEIEMIDDGE